MGESSQVNDCRQVIKHGNMDAVQDRGGGYAANFGLFQQHTAERREVKCQN